MLSKHALKFILLLLLEKMQIRQLSHELLLERKDNKGKNGTIRLNDNFDFHLLSISDFGPLKFYFNI